MSDDDFIAALNLPSTFPQLGMPKNPKEQEKDMVKHTPGPWEVTSMHKSIRPSFASPGENGGFAICEMYEGGKDRVANACLIAAAPQLLAVLEELSESAAYWSEYDVPIGIVDRINGAIATARFGAATGGAA